MNTLTTDNRETPEITWGGTRGIFIHCLKVFFLSMITMNIYYFWGKTNTRRKAWNAIHIQGQPLIYHGTGGELFVGALLVGMIVFVILFTIGYFAARSPIFIGALYSLIIYFLLFTAFLTLAAIALFRARKYQLSRTTWRGIRASQRGSSLLYGLHFAWTSILTLITLGLFLPYQLHILRKYRTNHTRFGYAPLTYTGKPWPLFKMYGSLWGLQVLLWTAAIYTYNTFRIPPVLEDEETKALRGAGLLDIEQTASVTAETPALNFELLFQITTGISVLLFFIMIIILVSKYMNYAEKHTRLDNAHFSMKSTPLSLLWLVLSNIFILAITFGIALPYAQIRSVRYYIERLSITGSVNMEEIAQNTDPQIAYGEGLAHDFDLGVI